MHQQTTYLYKFFCICRKYLLWTYIIENLWFPNISVVNLHFLNELIYYIQCTNTYSHFSSTKAKFFLSHLLTFSLFDVSSILLWWRAKSTLCTLAHFLSLSLELDNWINCLGVKIKPQSKFFILLVSLRCLPYIIRKQTAVYYVSRNRGEWCNDKCKHSVLSGKEKGVTEKRICRFSPALPTGQVFGLFMSHLALNIKNICKVERGSSSGSPFQFPKEHHNHCLLSSHSQLPVANFAFRWTPFTSPNPQEGHLPCRCVHTPWVIQNHTLK